MGQPWDGGYGAQPGGNPPSDGGYGSYGQTGGGYGAGYGTGGGYGGYGGYDPDPGAKTQAIIALCCNAVGILCCCPVGIAGTIVSIIALTKADTEGRTARTLLIWAWVLLGLGVVLAGTYLLLDFLGVISGAFDMRSY